MRVTLTVEVDLDDRPGPMYTDASARDIVEYFLKNQIPHYNPVVKIQIPAQRTKSS